MALHLRYGYHIDGGSGAGRVLTGLSDWHAQARVEDIDSLRVNTESAPMAGLGYGIPLSRLVRVP
jgi:hypothetical protein